MFLNLLNTFIIYLPKHRIKKIELSGKHNKKNKCII